MPGEVAVSPAVAIRGLVDGGPINALLFYVPRDWYFPGMRPGLDCGTVAPMKICIQHPGTRKFLQDINVWTEDGCAARIFANSIEAFRLCMEHRLTGVNILVERDGARPPVFIPVELNATSGQITTGFPLVRSR